MICGRAGSPPEELEDGIESFNVASVFREVSGLEEPLVKSGKAGSTGSLGLELLPFTAMLTPRGFVESPRSWGSNRKLRLCMGAPGLARLKNPKRSREIKSSEVYTASPRGAPEINQSVSFTDPRGRSHFRILRLPSQARLAHRSGQFLSYQLQTLRTANLIMALALFAVCDEETRREHIRLTVLGTRASRRLLVVQKSGCGKCFSVEWPPHPHSLERYLWVLPCSWRFAPHNLVTRPSAEYLLLVYFQYCELHRCLFSH